MRHLVVRALMICGIAGVFSQDAGAQSSLPGDSATSMGRMIDSLVSAGDAAALRRLVDSISSSADSAAAANRDTVRPVPILEALAEPDVPAQSAPDRIPKQLGFIALLFALFLVPKLLQRFRIPGAITSLLMGVAATSLGLFPHDPTINLLSTLGIVSLFLFAGLEVDGKDLRNNIRPLMLHAAIWTLLAAITAIGAAMIFEVSGRVAALLALAIVTPSTGFILSSLATFGLSQEEQKTVRIYAIGSELIALGVLFFLLQSTSLARLGASTAAMLGLVVVIPIAFRLFASIVSPHAPRSEFGFLLMVAIVCAYATRLLGVYYLVGAFIVGAAAQQYRASHPAMSSEKLIDALESFASVFIPFYFFHAGTEILAEHVTLKGAALGLLILAVFVPLRIAVIALHRRVVLGEGLASSRRIGSAMVPTLVFTLVIASILRDRFGMPSYIGGALVLYTILNTTLPAFFLRSQPADFEDVEALPLETAAQRD
jgi:Kef-type K+ transport system membrane component KefB